MRNILLCIVGAVAITGCAAHQSEWKVRDQHGWPVQTWDSGQRFELAVARPRQCIRPLIVRFRWQQPMCCDIPASTNSWGEYAAACGGDHAMRTIRARNSGGTVYVTGYYKNTPAISTPTRMPTLQSNAAPSRAVLTTRR